MELEQMVERLNRKLSGWANDFHIGQVLPAYDVIDQRTMRRLRQWLCRNQNVKSERFVRPLINDCMKNTVWFA